MDYIFKSWNDSWDFVYDIEDNMFQLLLEMCGKYCSYASFKYSDSENKEAQNFQVFKKFLVSSNYSFSNNLSSGRSFSNQINKQTASPKQEIRYLYNVNTEFIEKMIELSPKLFSWIDGWGYHNPEDPYFYRADGSVFLATSVHNCICCLFLPEGEFIYENLLMKNGGVRNGFIPLTSSTYNYMKWIEVDPCKLIKENQ